MSIDRREFGDDSKAPMQRRSWQPLGLRYVGEIKELVKGGTGKSGIADDPGDFLKPPGTE